MQLSVGLLMFIVGAAGVVWFWRQSLHLRSIANDAATEACDRLGLQFLDGTSAFGTWRWQREAGRLQLRRIYVFDYTANSIERRQGFVVLSRGRVESVGFAQDDQHRSAPSAAIAPTVNVTVTYGKPISIAKQPSDESSDDSEKTAIAAPRASDNNVFDLAEWRRTRRPGEPLH